MKLGLKREIALKRIEWFIPTTCDWNHEKTKLSDGTIGILGIIEDKDGMSAEEAFFSKTENGKLPKQVNSLARLRALLWGHKWMAAHEKMWREELKEYNPILRHLFVEQDFKNEPDYIKEIINNVLKRLD